MAPLCMLRYTIGLSLVAMFGCTQSAREPSTQAELAYQPALELASELASGERSSVEVTEFFLRRIEAIDRDGPSLASVIEINPDATRIAEELDRQLADQGPSGPLHGVPVLLKANIDTADGMATSAGSIALAEHRATADAALVAALRSAGAVILGKTNMSEWAYFRSDSATSGWSSLGGQTKNPYVLDRNPCGSSSGSAVAVAAGLAPLSVGTETDGSIICPASISGIVGIKPSIGLVSRRGIIPIAPSQDTAGPMARSVAGAALLLDTLLSEDEHDPLSAREAVRKARAESLLPDTSQARLDGVRLGVFRGRDSWPGDDVYAASLASLEALGATLIDPIDAGTLPAVFEDEFTVLLVEFKASLNTYLADSAVAPDRDTLSELITYNQDNAATVMKWSGQELFEAAQATQGLTDEAYLAALSRSRDGMRAWLDKHIDEHRLDGFVLPSNSPAWKVDWLLGDPDGGLFTSAIAAISGYPSVTVPAGFEHGLPIGLSFVGPMLRDAELIQIAYVFEQQTKARREPLFVPTLEMVPISQVP